MLLLLQLLLLLLLLAAAAVAAAGVVAGGSFVSENVERVFLLAFALFIFVYNMDVLLSPDV